MEVARILCPKALLFCSEQDFEAKFCTSASYALNYEATFLKKSFPQIILT